MGKPREPKQTEFSLKCPWCSEKLFDDDQLETHWQTCTKDPLRKLYVNTKASEERAVEENEHFRDILLAIKTGRMPCISCRYRNRCASALDAYNIGTEAKTDCLEAK